MEGEKISEGQFNQAGYSMIRLHERFLENQRLFAAPLLKNVDTGYFNYEVIFYNLVHILSEIRSKLTKTEKDEGKKMRDEVLLFMRKSPIFEFRTSLAGYRSSLKRKLVINSKNWDFLQILLFDFADFLYEKMEVHGLGNPSKNKSEAITR